MLKKIFLVVALFITATVSMGAANASQNPLVGKYNWHNIHFDTYCQMEITEESFFGLPYRMNGQKGKEVYLTVFELGNHEAKFIIVSEKNGKKIIVNRMGNDNKYHRIAEAERM